MSEINLVRQEEDFGCLIACAATVLERPYHIVKDDFSHNFGRSGIKVGRIWEYLAEHGLDIIEKRIRWFNHHEFGKEELLKPFADIHIVSLRGRFDHAGHAVIMGQDGRIHCPAGGTEESVRAAYAITSVLGIYFPSAGTWEAKQ